jgi:hypothetical protein
MAETYKKLAQDRVGSSVETVYTVPGGTSAIVKHIRLVNPTAGAATVALWHDGTADVNIILPPVSLGAGEWAEFDGSILMEAADTLHADSDTADAVTITVYGLEIT